MTHRIEETVARNICIGCGACAVATDGQIALYLDPIKRIYQADLSNASPEAVRAGSAVCPFSDEAPNEDALGLEFRSAESRPHRLIGAYSHTFAGRVTDDTYLAESSSGGLASWFTQRLIDRGYVDALLSVGRNSGAEKFTYQIVLAPDDARSRKSHYYAATLNDVLDVAAGSGMRFALTGVPCYIKAVRALQAQDPVLRDRIRVLVGLVCGHMKSQGFGESLAWQLGVHPKDVAELDFRMKAPYRAAIDYDFGVRAQGSDTWVRRPTKDLVGANWGHNAFQPEACNFCDDVVAETSDISFGDAWLPAFMSDSRGTNVVVLRNPALRHIFTQGEAEGEVITYPLTPDEVATSQAGGFRHRREGLALRLADDLALGLSVPRKRVAPDPKAVPPRRASLLRQRRLIAEASQKAFADALAKDSLGLYLAQMEQLIQRYRRIDLPIHLWAARRASRLLGVAQAWAKQRRAK